MDCSSFSTLSIICVAHVIHPVCHFVVGGSDSKLPIFPVLTTVHVWYSWKFLLGKFSCTDILVNGCTYIGAPWACPLFLLQCEQKWPWGMASRVTMAHHLQNDCVDMMFIVDTVVRKWGEKGCYCWWGANSPESSESSPLLVTEMYSKSRALLKHFCSAIHHFGSTHGKCPCVYLDKFLTD